MKLKIRARISSKLQYRDWIFPSSFTDAKIENLENYLGLMEISMVYAQSTVPVI
jgi:hypothetical protein